MGGADPMTTCTVRDLLHLVMPPGTRLLTPEAGLDQRIQHALCLTPATTQPVVCPGDLVVVQGVSPMLDDILMRLQRTPGIVLAIIGEVAAELLKQAELLQMPLLSILARQRPMRWSARRCVC